MSRRRGSQGFPFFALLLIVTGVLLLLQTLGVVPWGMWIDLWRLWPVLLIAAGVAILLGRGAPWLAGFIIVALLAGVVALAYTASDRFGGGTNTITLEEALDETERLKATLDVGAGVITLGSLSSESEELFRGEFRSGRRSGVESTFTRTGDTATLKLERKRGAFFFGSVKEEWTLDISRAVTVELAINAGAVELRGDLSALDVRDLVLKAGASTIVLTLPGMADDAKVRLEVGAASVEVRVPEGVAARIRTDTGLSSVDVDTERFPKVGDYYQSPNYGSAARRMEVEIKGGVSDITVR